MGVVGEVAWDIYTMQPDTTVPAPGFGVAVFTEQWS